MRVARNPEVASARKSASTSWSWTTAKISFINSRPCETTRSQHPPPAARIPLIGSAVFRGGLAKMSRDKRVMLADLTWPEASSALNGAVILLPVGAIEAHGPHLPLNTDVIIAREAALRTCARISGPAAVLPEISYGVSYVGTCFPGTTPVPPDALTRMINEILVTSLDVGAIAAIIV